MNLTVFVDRANRLFFRLIDPDTGAIVVDNAAPIDGKTAFEVGVPLEAPTPTLAAVLAEGNDAEGAAIDNLAGVARVIGPFAVAYNTTDIATGVDVGPELPIGTHVLKAWFETTTAPDTADHAFDVYGSQAGELALSNLTHDSTRLIYSMDLAAGADQGAPSADFVGEPFVVGTDGSPFLSGVRVGPNSSRALVAATLVAYVYTTDKALTAGAWNVYALVQYP